MVVHGITPIFSGALLAVLPVADLFQPIDGFAIFGLLNGDMCHASSGCGAVPLLHAPGLGGNDQRLAQRMGLPGRTSSRLEGYVGARGLQDVVRGKERVNPHGAGALNSPFSRRSRISSGEEPRRMPR